MMGLMAYEREQREGWRCAGRCGSYHMWQTEGERYYITDGVDGFILCERIGFKSAWMTARGYDSVRKLTEAGKA